MSETDSFIEEVTEEVRNERLYGYLRRYGWIAAVVIIALVGGTAFSEFRKSQASQIAEVRGDAIFDALELEDEAVSLEQLAALAAKGDASLIEKLLSANSGDAASLAVLNAIALDGDLAVHYTDLAKLKLTILDTDMDAATKTSNLESLATPGALFRGVATEYLAAHHLDSGDRESAIALLKEFRQDAEATNQQRQRFTELLIALGVTEDLENVLDDATGVQQN